MEVVKATVLRMPNVVRNAKAQATKTLLILSRLVESLE
jgi:hypothetical protein